MRCILFTLLIAFTSCTKNFEPETVNLTYIVEPGPNEIEVKYYTKNEEENTVQLIAGDNWKKDVELYVGQEYYLDAKTKNINSTKTGTCKIFLLKGNDTLQFQSFEVEEGMDLKWATLEGKVEK